MLTGPVIKTYVLRPTTHRGTRVKAIHNGSTGKRWNACIPWHYGSNEHENHYNAACALIEKWSFKGVWKIVAKGWDDDAYYWIYTADTTESLPI